MFVFYKGLIEFVVARNDHGILSLQDMHVSTDNCFKLESRNRVQ